MKFLKSFIPIITALFFICGCNEITGQLSSEPQHSEITGKINGNLRVHFIDIGQGDCEFIELPDGSSMLIDAGEIGKDRIVINYIKALGYKKINYIVATHPHSDHIGGMSQVLSEFSADFFYMPEKAHSSGCFSDMLTAVQKNGCSAEYITAGKVLLNSEEYGFKVSAVAPVKAYDDLNNSSAVLRLVYKNTSFLFTGDAEKESEYDILESRSDINADVLKLGHHGSSTSSSMKFLNKVNPKYGIISCEKENSYGHPHTETISSLDRLGIEYFRTDTDGTIIFETDGESGKYNISIEKNDKHYLSESTTQAEADVPVFRTKTGKCYHIEGCDGLKRTKIPTTIDEATELGLRPCPNCKPPQN